jgi:signal transduction histidine kinase
MGDFSDRLSALYDISTSLQSLELDEVLSMILDGVTRTIGFDRARLYLVDEDKNVLKCVMAVGLEPEMAREIVLPLKRDGSVVANAAINRKPYIVKDALSDTRVNLDIVRRLNIRSFVAVPMIGREKAVGVVSADNLHSNREITDEDFKLLVTFVNQAGVAIENAGIYEELKKLNESLERRIQEALKELEQSQRQLMQSEKLAALGQIAAGVAHELRNPLTSIKILVHFLIEEFGLKKERREDVEVIRHEISKMEELIKRFLNFARPSSPILQRVNVNEVLGDVLQLMEYQFRESDVALKISFTSDAEITGDKDQLHQLFLNIILNAMHAMTNGGDLHVATERNGNVLTIEIRDTGTGIPKSILDKIFDPFFTTKDEGIGLGLSIVQRIVEEHKGSTDLASDPGKGTSFRVHLPVGGDRNAQVARGG